jgi:V/A-type H+-transporting ATPase subunit K
MERRLGSYRRAAGISTLVTIGLALLLGFLATGSAPAQAPSAAGQAASAQAATAQAAASEVQKFGLVAAAVAFGFGAVSAGLAIAHVGSAAMGAIAEKPEIASQALIFIALAEGLVVFGFITALMILGKF